MGKIVQHDLKTLQVWKKKTHHINWMNDKNSAKGNEFTRRKLLESFFTYLSKHVFTLIDFWKNLFNFD